MDLWPGPVWQQVHDREKRLFPQSAPSAKASNQIGEDFAVVVTATDAIPDGEEAILTITDFTGKRKFEIKMDASAPK